jgi:hypothetical protein
MAEIGPEPPGLWCFNRYEVTLSAILDLASNLLTVTHSTTKVPDEASMILVPNESEMQHVSGLARYQLEFEETV